MRQFLLTFLGFAALCAAQTTITPVPFLVCVTCRVDREPHSMHAEFAARYYAAEFPHLAVSTKFIGHYEAGGTTQRGLIRAKVANGSACQATIGPGSSGIAVAMNPLVDEYWMDYSATSTELSSRFNFPLFNRVVPTDEDATSGWAPLLEAFDWGTFNVVCTDTAYGRSVASGMSAVAGRLGGTTGAIACVPVDGTADDAGLEIRRLLNSGVRAATVAMASDSPFFEVLVDEILRTRAYESIAFLFAESACSSADQPWRRVPGAFCTTFTVNPDVFLPFTTAYNARDTGFAAASYASLGWPAPLPFTATGVYPAYATDATRFTLRALNQYVAEHGGQLPPSVEEGTAYIRNYTMAGGVSGRIVIPTGNRDASDMVVYNSRADGSLAVVANTTAAGNVSVAATFTAFGRADMTVADVPPSVAPAAEAAAGGTPLWVIVVVVLLLVLILGGGAAFAATRPPPGRDNSVAPKKDSEAFTVIFTDIQSSTSQWAVNADVFGAAVDLHHELIRKVLRAHRGYEVKTIGDSFMAAFASPVDALRCSLAIQEELFAAEWPACIDELYIRRAHEAGITDVQPDDDTYDELWSGIRVRVGMHYGMGNIKLDPVSQGYDYYGTVVNTAARVEGVGHGGQVLLTDAAYEAVSSSTEGAELIAAKTSVVDLGPQPLRGLAEPVALLQVMPNEFAHRGFPPLRLDVEVEVEGPGDSDDDASDASDLSRASGASAMTSGSTDGKSKIPKDAPEYACKKAVRRLKGQATFDSMVFQYHVVKALFSTVPPKDRFKVVFDLCDKWRVVEAKSLKPKASASQAEKDKATDRAAAYLAVKTAPVAAAYVSPYVGRDDPVANMNDLSQDPSWGGTHSAGDPRKHLSTSGNAKRNALAAPSFRTAAAKPGTTSGSKYAMSGSRGTAATETTSHSTFNQSTSRSPGSTSLPAPEDRESSPVGVITGGISMHSPTEPTTTDESAVVVKSTEIWRSGTPEPQPAVPGAISSGTPRESEP